MATRYLRNTVILAKIESTYGTDPTPTGGSNAMLVSNLSINPLSANNVPRDLIRGYKGGFEQLVGTAYVEASFDVEMQSSGSMVTPTVPAWDPLMRACGFAATSTANVRVEYNPVSSSEEGCTIYYHSDGVLHKLLGCRGNVSIAAGIGERPVFKFRFLGLNGGVTATANATPTLTSWKTPLVVTDTNSGDITLGTTYTAATPTFTGGTSYPSRGISIDIGNAVAHTPLLGGESIDIANREVSGHVDFDLTAAQEVSFMTTVLANTTQSLGWIHGTSTGYKVLVYGPAIQLINPTKVEANGKLLIGYDLRLVPSAGNDEIKIVCA